MAQQRFNATLDEHIIRELKMRAVNEEVTASDIVERALLAYFDRMDADEDEVSEENYIDSLLAKYSRGKK